jgi:hypothetical protein
VIFIVFHHLKTVLVHFEFSHPTAVAVSIAGPFNDWHLTAKPMHPSGAVIEQENQSGARHLRILPDSGRSMARRMLNASTLSAFSFTNCEKASR